MAARLPNFVVVGAPKCGTTSLYHYLRQHPDVFLPERKELHYFSYPAMRKVTAGPGDNNILTTSCETLDQYQAFYAPARGETAIGDISPSYFYFADVATDMHATLGDAKIIVMLRDPVQKAFSQYMHLIRDNRETLDFNSALRAESDRIKQGYSAMWRYAESSLFTQRIQRYIAEFGSKRVKVVLFDDLTRSPGTVVAEIFEFLGVDPGVKVQLDSTFNRSGAPRSRFMANLIAKPNFVVSAARRLLPLSVTGKVRDLLQRANTGAKPALDAEARDSLRRFFSADLADLERLLGRSTGWRKDGPAATSNDFLPIQKTKA